MSLSIPNRLPASSAFEQHLPLGLFATGTPGLEERSIKALSIVRPSGGRIACGQKTLEIRRWRPDLDPAEDLLIVENGRFLHIEGDEDPDGIAVAMVRVKAVRPFVPDDMQAACASYFEEGWLAWELTDIRPISPPVTLRAARGIYEVDWTSADDSAPTLV